MDKTEARRLSNIIEAALKTALAPQGYNVEIKGGKFSDDSFDPKVVIVKQGVNLGTQNFMRFAHLYGLKPQDHGREFVSNGVRYRLTGLAPNRPRFPILGERVPDGKKFKFPREVVQKFT